MTRGHEDEYMVELKTLSVKNFLSVGDTPIVINFDEHHRTIINGANGVGKSTLFIESICYALYGKPFRSLKKGQLINIINKKGTMVDLSFLKNNVEFRVKRGQKPNVFEIYKDGELLQQTASITEYQELLDQIIGIELNTFKQIVAIGTAGYLPFMQLPTYKRRAMIEDLVGIDVFSIINDFNKSSIRDLKVEDKTNDVSITAKKEQYKLHKAYQDEQQLAVESQIESIEEMIKQNDEKIKTLLDENINHDNKIELLKSTAETVKDITLQIDKHKQTLVALKSEKTFIAKKKQLLDDHNSCPTCEQGIDISLKETQYPIIESKISDIMDKAIGISDKIKLLASQQIEAKTAQTNIDTYSADIRLNEQTIKSSERSNNRLRDSIEELLKPKEDMSEHLDRTADELKELVNTKKEITDELFNRDIIKNMIGDTGVKKFIIGQYIPLLNGYVNHYLDALGADYVFILDEEFNETIKSNGRDTFTYTSFSQGERSRIDLSIILAFRKLVEARSNNVAIMNVFILDEVLDSSLDGAGTDNVNSLLKEISKENGGTKLFVISHNPNNVTSGVWTDSIELTKVGNFTQISKNTL